MTKMVVWSLLSLSCLACTEGLATSDADLRDTIVINAQSYPDRLRLLDIVAEAHPYFREGPIDGAWSGDPSKGIRLQTQWQHDSGRSFPNEDGLGTGWWTNVNYTLSVWPALALQSRGELANVTILPMEGDRFEMPEDIKDDWLTYYDNLADARAETGTMSPEEADRTAYELQEVLWVAHQNALDVGLARNEDEMDKLPEGEQKFGPSWGYTAVPFLVASNFPTDEEFANFFREFLLPQRVVTDEDFTGNPTDFTFAQVQSIRRFWDLHVFERDHGDLLLKVWKKVSPILPKEAPLYALRKVIESDANTPITEIVSDVYCDDLAPELSSYCFFR